MASIVNWTFYLQDTALTRTFNVNLECVMDYNNEFINHEVSFILELNIE